MSKCRYVIGVTLLLALGAVATARLRVYIIERQAVALCSEIGADIEFGRRASWASLRRCRRVRIKGVEPAIVSLRKCITDSQVIQGTLELHCSHFTPSPSFLREITRFPTLRKITFECVDLSTAPLELLSHCSDLSTLEAVRCDAAAGTWRRLSLVPIRYLLIDNVRSAVESAPVISQMERLEGLDLAAPAVPDAALGVLCNARHLSWVVIRARGEKEKILKAASLQQGAPRLIYAPERDDNLDCCI